MKVLVHSPMPPAGGGFAADDTVARTLLRLMFEVAVASADPARVLACHLPQPPATRCVVVGAGKAAASMAAAVEQAWPEVALSGCVAVPYGYAKECKRIRVHEAGHPVPDANSVAAAREMLAAVEGLQAGDLVLALISGGGSAAMCLPADGLSLEEKQKVNRLLLSSGLDIRTMNAVRRRLSAIKGGRLAAAAVPARVLTLVVSDIPGDDLSAIASGPTAEDTTAALPLDGIISELGPDLPPTAARLLAIPGQKVPVGNADPIRVIATASDALVAAAGIANAHGIEPIILGDDVEGEARLVAQEMARQVLHHDRPTVLLSGGETTVSVGQGKPGVGGRNTEFLLALAIALEGRAGVWAIAADTDGIDGANHAAGALIGPDSLSRAKSAGLDAQACLSTHDSGTLFAALGDLVVTGPTFTNVNDFRAILVLPQTRD